MTTMIEIPTDPAIPGEADRRAETRRRVRMLDGDWRQEAEERLADFFAPEVQEFLPAAELSRNPFASFTAQIALLYDEPYTVTVGDDEEGSDAEGEAVEVGGELLALQQDLLRYVVGCNDAALRLDPYVEESGKVSLEYRIVTMDLLYVETDAMDTDRVLYVEEDRTRAHPDTGKPCWTKERWDLRGPEPQFSIVLVNSNGETEDVTAAYMPLVGWPERYRDRGGKAVIPYILYHRYVGSRWATPYRGQELVDGTLTVAALWTMWVAGVRDGAFPARVVVDGEIRGGTVDRGVAAGATKSHVINPLAVLQIVSNGAEGRSASFGQFQPSIDPRSAGEAVEQFEAGLAVHAGLSPTDVARGSSGQSGYSIVVSRDGQRRQMAKLRVPMAHADAQRCAVAARLLNAGNPDDEALPETSDAYSIQYSALPQAPEEVKADLDRVTALMEAGLMSKVQAYMEVHPGSDEKGARRALAEIEGHKEEPQMQPPPGGKVAPVLPNGENDDVESMVAAYRAHLESRAQR